jgi:hypothetical protein
MIRKTAVLAVILAIVAGSSVFASTTVSLAPARQLRVDGWGGVVDNNMVAWADGGEYRVAAEFDISPYKGKTVVSATLQFDAGAIWAGGYYLDVDQIPSDLWIDQSDFASVSMAKVAQSQWNNGGRSYDVTALVTAALPSSTPNPGYWPWGKGIQFRLSDSSGLQLTYGYTVNNVKLVLVLDSVDITPYVSPDYGRQFLRVDSWDGVNFSNWMVAWADGGEYRDAADFDISPYIGKIISRATLSFDAQAIWAGGNILNVDQIPSRLHIDSRDFGSTPLANVVQNSWNNGGKSFDVTSLVVAALPLAVADQGNPLWGQGIQFRWSDSSGQQLSYGYTVSNPKLTLDFEPQTLTIGQFKAQPDGTVAQVKNVVVTATPAAPGAPYYVQAEGMPSGIRVRNGAAFQVDDKVDITGTIRTETQLERYIDVLASTKVGTGHITPVGMETKAVGGAEWNYNSSTGAGYVGTVDSAGLNNMGTLITTWGTITDVGDGLTFWLTGADGRWIMCADFSTNPTSYIGSHTFGVVTGVVAVRDVVGGLIDPVIVLRNGNQDFVGLL